jgi:uncharacterized protein (DUF849 family)
MEDTLTFAPGQPVRDNEQLVVRAAGFARHALRPPMSTDEARAMLGVKRRQAIPAQGVSPTQTGAQA